MQGALQIKILVYFVLSLGLLCRLLSSAGELWLDELWSLEIVAGFDRFLDAFQYFETHNHHLLNSLYLNLFSQESSEILLRFLSTLSSMLLLLWLFRKAQRSRHDLFFFILCSFSFPFILFGSEARGYSLALLCAAVSLSCYRSFLHQRDSRVFLFQTACIVGMLAHPTFLFIYFSYLATDILLLLHPSTKKTLSDMYRRFKFFSLSLVVAVLYIRYFVAQFPPGSGTFYSAADVAFNLLAMSLGGPDLHANFEQNALPVLVIGLGSVFCVLLELRFLMRESGKDVVFFFLSIIAIPILTIVVLEPRVIYERYFLIPALPFLYILSCFLSRLSRASFQGLLLSSLALCFVSAVSLFHCVQLFQTGRVQYSSLFPVLEAQAGPKILALDHDFRHKYSLNRYGQESWSYLAEVNAKGEDVRWFLRHRQDNYDIAPESKIKGESGLRWQHHSSFRGAPLSGWALDLYKRESS